MPILKKAMCCWPLSVGTSVVGWIGILLGLLEMLFCIQIYLSQIFPLEYRQSVLCLCAAACHVIISILLLKAVHSNKSFYLIPWLMTVAFTLAMLNGFSLSLIQDLLQMVQYLIPILILNFIVAYIWIWIFSFYEQLVEAELGIGNNHCRQKV